MEYDEEDHKASNGKEIYINMKERRLAFFSFRSLFHYSVNSQTWTLERRLQITMFLKTKDSQVFCFLQTDQ